MAEKMIMPEMGEGVIEGTISKWLKQVGDYVDQYEPVLEIETDKVTTEAMSEVAGFLLEQCVQEGDVIPVGTTLAYIGEKGEAVETSVKATAPSPSLGADSTPSPAKADPSPSRAAHSNGDPSPRNPTPQPYTGRISPVVSRIAAEHAVSLDLVTGTGRDGRITKNDILTYIEQRSSQPESAPSPVSEPEPAVAPAPPHRVTVSPPPPSLPGKTVPLSNMRRAIAEHMVRSKHTSPHVTTVFEVDFTAVFARRQANKDQFERDGANLTFTAYIISAIVQALKAHPLVNSSWSDNGIVLHRAINVGMAAAIDEGLIVPVIKNTDGMNLLGLARTINDLTERARTKQLQPGDVQGGTFTLTNHGTSGSLFATPIINQPQCGILGVGKIEKRVKVIDDAIAIRPLAYVSLTFDHRILDGKSADDFVALFKDIIESWH
jgi:2-oxoglutarate dehydrogenase E2 component (dihydrolipoamide succinyltransferase)